MKDVEDEATENDNFIKRTEGFEENLSKSSQGLCKEISGLQRKLERSHGA